MAKSTKKAGRPRASDSPLSLLKALEKQRDQILAEAAALKDRAIREKEAALKMARSAYEETKGQIGALEKELIELGSSFLSPGRAAAPPAAPKATKKAAKKGAKKAAKKATKKAAKKAAKPAAKKGAKKGAKKAAKGKPGRKPRVDTQTKIKHAEEVLKGHSKGVAFSQLRKALQGRKLADGTPVYSSLDLASSKQFGKKYLPKGYKVVGERRDAKVVKG